MKKILLLLIVCLSYSAQAQFGYGNGQRQRQRQMQQMQTPQKAPEPNFNVERYLGIIIYDIKKAAKKSSIKLTSQKGKEFSKIITKYNKNTKDITRINSFLLRNTKEMVENFQKNAIKNGDFSKQAKIRKEMNVRLKPIGEVILEEDRKLNDTIKKLLSEKQYKKWIKYNRKNYKFFREEQK
jgi:hypothetical protein